MQPYSKISLAKTFDVSVINLSYSLSNNNYNNVLSFILSTNNISISLSEISIGFYILFDSPKNRQNNNINKDTDGENIRQDESNENVWW